MRRRSRYANIRRYKCDGHTFDSKRELVRYQELKLAERAGAIADLELHPRIPITIGGVEVRYPNGRHLTYIADFRYLDRQSGETITEDVKMQSGHRTEVYKIKRALVAAMGVSVLET